MTVLPFRHRAPPVLPLVEPDSDSFVISTGGVRSSLNLVRPTVIKPAPGRIAKLIVVSSGTDGAFSINDCAEVAMASASNLIFTIGYGVKIGAVIDLDWPCAVGIVLSAVPPGGILAVSYL